jgi:hypothetical protein
MHESNKSNLIVKKENISSKDFVTKVCNNIGENSAFLKFQCLMETSFFYLDPEICDEKYFNGFNMTIKLDDKNKASKDFMISSCKVMATKDISFCEVLSEFEKKTCLKILSTDES